METELLQLQAENRRLSALVAALAEKNLRLEAALAAGGANRSASFPELIASSANGKVFLPDGPVNRQNGNVSFPDTGANLDTGKASGSDMPAGRASANAFFPEPTLSDASGKESFPESPQEAGDHTLRLRRIAAASLDPETVGAALARSLMRGCRKPHCRDAAKLLIWFCAVRPDILRYPALQACLGRTYGGTAKLLLSVKKHGVLRRLGHCAYTPSEAALCELEGLLPPGVNNVRQEAPGANAL